MTTISRFTPLLLAPDRVALNRVVVPAMASGTATVDGFSTEATVAHYSKLAEARPGILFVEYTYVHPSGRSEENQLGAYVDAQVNGLTQLASSIRAAGIIPGLQLTHAGGKASRDLTDGRLMAPSNERVPVKDRILDVPDAMTDAEIDLWRDSFVAAAIRGAEAGFEILELHCAHGYGINQWLSPLTNRREDAYGGDLTGRMRLLLEIIGAIRARLPGVLLSARIPGQDFIPGGLTVLDSQEISRRLAAAGVSIINVSSGLGGWRRPNTRSGEGYLVPEAASIQAAVAVPVIGVGGIQSGAYVDESLASGRFALAAVGRAILAGPDEWRRQNLAT